MSALADPARVTRAIFEHAARISRAQDVPELIRLNADFARDLVGADRCSLWLVDERRGELWTMVAHGVDAIRIPYGKGLAGACVSSGEVLLANDLSTDPRFLRTVDANSGYHTEQVLCVPLRAERRVIGALQLLNKPGGFTEDDAGLVGLLAHFAASAIESERLRQEAESARLLRHELDLARDVQARLLPQEVPAPEGIAVAGYCRPAKLVGGDYYDLLHLNDGRFAFTLGDVSGKGIAAAVMMASIQTLLRSLLQRTVTDQSRPNGGYTLADAVTELNRALYESSTSDRYSTLFCGVLDLENMQITYVNAGHVVPLLFRGVAEGGEILELEGGGMPVGLLPMTTYEQMSVPLRPGDTLLVVSDGIMEACNAMGEFWDDVRVREVLRSHCLGEGAHVRQLPEVLCAEVDAWAAGAEQYDDMTVVAVSLA
jgi:sigma-B regulation protein RsbU (phosphoserine phosphatase)